MNFASDTSNLRVVGLLVEYDMFAPFIP